MPAVSVIIPARNDALHLAAAVASAVDQRDIELAECVIAVGPSGDATEQRASELADRYEPVHVVANAVGTIPHGLNLALARTTGDVIVRVDAHCVLPPGYVARAVRTMQEVDAANVVAVQVPVGAHPTEEAIAAAMRHGFGSGGAEYRQGTKPGPVDTGYLGVFDRASLELVGGWDESLLRNEDTELNLRLAAATDKPIWLDPDLRVEYHPRSTLGRLMQQYWHYGRWRYVTTREHPGSLRLRQVAAPILVAGTMACVIASALFSPWFLAVPALYVLIVVGAAMATTGLSVSGRARMAAALVAMHVSWGSGFLASALRRPR